MTSPGSAALHGLLPFAVESSSLRWERLPPLWVVVLLIVPGVFLAARFFYQREAGRVGRRLRIAMGALRALALLLVLGALFGPYVETVKGEETKRHLILCVDTSESMAIQDAYQARPEIAARIREAAGYGPDVVLGTRTRLDVVRDVLRRDPAWLEELARRFKLHLYTFDGDAAGAFVPREDESPAEAVARLLPVLAGLKAEGTVTRIGTTIASLARAFEARNEPVAGVLLLTDGRQTGGPPLPAEEARRAARGGGDGLAVFPVAIGDPAAAINVAVSRLDAPEVVLAGDDVTFTAHVHAHGLEGRPARLEAVLLDDDDRVTEVLPVAMPLFDLPADGADAVKVSFRHRFDTEGTRRIRIGVPPIPGEAVEGDNARVHTLTVRKLKMRVLLVSSGSNYDYRFLTPALKRARETIEANMLLLSSDPGWPQEASAGVEPIERFPRTRAELAPFDVVVLLDVDLNDRRISGGTEEGRAQVLGLVEEWVKGGGGLVLVGGHQGNLPGKNVDPTLRALLPVVPYSSLTHAATESLVQPRIEKRYRLTPAGRESAMLRVMEDERDSLEFWDGDDYATFYCWYVPMERAKSSATVLAVRRDAEGDGPPPPLIALQEYGLGKTLWIGTDELWRMRKKVENLYYWRLWSNMIRHLATYRLLGGNRRIKIWVDRADGRYQIGESVGVEAKFLDENFEPVMPTGMSPEETVRTLKLRAPGGEETTIDLRAVDTDPPEGLFRGRTAAARPGTWRLVAEAGPDEEPAEATFTVEKTTLESRDPLLDMRTLQSIAQASGTRVLSPHQLHTLLDEDLLPRTAIYRTGETERRDLWDSAWLLLAFVALVGLEWILRRANLLL